MTNLFSLLLLLNLLISCSNQDYLAAPNKVELSNKLSQAITNTASESQKFQRSLNDLQKLYQTKGIANFRVDYTPNDYQIAKSSDFVNVAYVTNTVPTRAITLKADISPVSSLITPSPTDKAVMEKDSSSERAQDLIKFYSFTEYFPNLFVTGQEWLVIMPTAPYFPRQFLAVPKRQQANTSDVEAVFDFLQISPPNTIVAQNSMTSSSDPKYKHIQITTAAEYKAFPYFLGLDKEQFEISSKSTLLDGKLLKEIIGPSYVGGHKPAFVRFVYPGNSAGRTEIVELLKAEQDYWLAKGLELTIIGRKLDSKDEITLVVRTPASNVPGLELFKQKYGAINLGGWIEALGMVVFKGREMTPAPLQAYSELLELLTVDARHQ